MSYVEEITKLVEKKTGFAFAGYVHVLEEFQDMGLHLFTFDFGESELKLCEMKNLMIELQIHGDPFPTYTKFADSVLIVIPYTK